MEYGYIDFVIAISHQKLNKAKGKSMVSKSIQFDEHMALSMDSHQPKQTRSIRMELKIAFIFIFSLN